MHNCVYKFVFLSGNFHIQQQCQSIRLKLFTTKSYFTGELFSISRFKSDCKSSSHSLFLLRFLPSNPNQRLFLLLGRGRDSETSSLQLVLEFWKTSCEFAFEPHPIRCPSCVTATECDKPQAPTRNVLYFFAFENRESCFIWQNVNLNSKPGEFSNCCSASNNTNPGKDSIESLSRFDITFTSASAQFPEAIFRT